MSDTVSVATKDILSALIKQELTVHLTFHLPHTPHRQIIKLIDHSVLDILEL